jgi:hypothetical protein
MTAAIKLAPAHGALSSHLFFFFFFPSICAFPFYHHVFIPHFLHLAALGYSGVPVRMGLGEKREGSQSAFLGGWNRLSLGGGFLPSALHPFFDPH